jgi:sugar lactone lactonase YvrE
MKKFVSALSVLIITAFVAACGNSSTTSEVVLGTPSVRAPNATALSKTLLGGSIQGTPLAATLSIVSTVAGSPAGPSGFGTANGAITAARFYQPNGITTDGKGNLFITDYRNHTIRQIDADGNVTTLAGIAGIAGYANTAPGVTATFYFPNAITTDGDNLYVTDASFSVRKIVISTKEVSTLAGLATSPGSIDSTDAKGTSARFNLLNGITTDGNYIYVTDSNSTIRWIDKNSGEVRTLAGYAGVAGELDGIQKMARFNQPARITCDGPNLYVCDFNNRTIRKIEIATGAVTTIAGITGPLGTDEGTADGIGTAAHFYQPNGITTDGTNLYVTDSYQNTIRKIVIATGAANQYEVTTISGKARSVISGEGGYVNSSVPGESTFYTPIGITTDGTSLFVADSQNNAIRKISNL